LAVCELAVAVMLNEIFIFQPPMVVYTRPGPKSFSLSFNCCLRDLLAAIAQFADYRQHNIASNSNRLISFSQ
jgi:hypothetical protein